LYKKYTRCGKNKI